MNEAAFTVMYGTIVDRIEKTHNNAKICADRDRDKNQGKFKVLKWLIFTTLLEIKFLDSEVAANVR